MDKLTKEEMAAILQVFNSLQVAASSPNAVEEITIIKSVQAKMEAGLKGNVLTEDEKAEAAAKWLRENEPFSAQ